MAATLSPIIMLPGLTGSIIEAQKGPGPAPPECEGVLTDEFQIIWLSITKALKFSCYEKMTSLRIDANATSYDPDFVRSRVPPDDIYATSYVDPHDFITRRESAYMGPLYAYLEKLGYIRYANMDAVAFDWRMSPYNYFESGQYFTRLKQKVESMFERSAGQKVTLVGHSMGGATGTLFLSTYVDPAWKAKYIKQFISVSGVYAGAVKPLGAVSTGTQDFFSSHLASIMRHLPGVHALVPPPDEVVPVWGNHTLFSIGDTNYTTADIKQLYVDLDLEEYVPVIDHLRSIGYHNNPGVRVHCLMNLDTPTISSIHIASKSAADMKNPQFSMGLGDGTVPDRSLKVCSSWASLQPEKVTTHEFTATNHADMIIKDTAVWHYIYKAANEDETEPHTV